jgi:hypothetical protein
MGKAQQPPRTFTTLSLFPADYLTRTRLDADEVGVKNE